MFIKEGKEHVFNEYESSVLPILKDYNGKLMYRIRPRKEDFIEFEGEKPYELHLISFETNVDFTNFINDDKRKSFEKVKEECIRSTFIIQGQKL